MTIDLATSGRSIAGARAEGEALGLKPFIVVILDLSGHVVVAEREGGSANKRFELAFGKAHAALALGVRSRALMQQADRQTYFARFKPWPDAVSNSLGGPW